MKLLVVLTVVAVASCSPLGGNKRSYAQYDAPSVYSYQQPTAYVSSSPQYIASSQYVPSSSFVSSTPEFVSSSQYVQSAPQYIQSSPQYYQASSDYITSPQYVSSSPEFVSRQYAPATVGYVASSPQYVQTSDYVSSPQYVARAPEFVSTPQYVSSSPQWSGAVVPVSRQWSSSESSSQSASSYSENIPYGYNTNSYRASQPVQVQKVYGAPAPARRWDAVRNTWC